MKKRCYPVILSYFLFRNRELERNAEEQLSRAKNEKSERREAFLMGKRFNVLPLCNIKSHFVTIDSGVLYGIMREISPEFDVSREEFTGENRETHWMNIFDFKRLKASKQKVFTGMIEADGVAMCVHYRRLKADRPSPFPISPVTNREENDQADPATQHIQDNELVVALTGQRKTKAHSRDSPVLRPRATSEESLPIRNREHLNKDSRAHLRR